MKQLIVLTMVLLAMAAAVFFHARKIVHVREAPDEVALSLRGIESRLQPDQAVNLRLREGVPSEYFLYVRLALAPRHVELVREGDPADTFLLVRPKEPGDTWPASARPIWSADGAAYDYLLLSSE